MNETTIEQIEADILAYEVSDEAVEAAAATGIDKADYTLGGCTGLSVCPA
jgi:hypothetical protein